MSIVWFLIAAQAAPPITTVQNWPPPPPPPAPVITIVPFQHPPASPRPPIPRGNQANWVTEDDYPNSAPWLGKPQGEVAYRLLVDSDGRALKCHIAKSSGSKLLDKTTCELVTRRARFSPAIDKWGQPSVGTWHGEVRWTIPIDRELRIAKPPIPGETIVTYLIDIDGRAKECKVESGPHPVTFMLWAMPCDFNQVFPVQRDAQSQPVPRKVRLVLTVQNPKPEEPSGE